MTESNQHLPEGRFECKDCHFSFNTAKEFSDHFIRDGIFITGCKTVDQVGQVAEIPAGA